MSVSGTRLDRAGWLPGAALLLLLWVTWLCFSPGLPGPLLLDDEIQLPPLMQSVDAGNWTTRARDFLVSDTGPGGRPVAMASFVASVVAHGADVRALKRENVLLHLLCGVLVFAWIRVLEQAMARRTGTPAPVPWRALYAAALWLVHPLMVSTVLYTIQRMTVLSTLFTLAGLWAWSAGREAQARGRAKYGGVMLGLALLVCLPLAAFSKENGVLLLPLCACLELTAFRGDGSFAQRRALRALFGALLVLPAVLTATVLLPRVAASFAIGYSLRGFTLGERLLTEARALGFYLREWFLPTPAALSFYHDDFAVSHGWLNPWTTLPAVLLVLGMAALAWHLRRRSPLVALGMMVFLVGHSLESSVVPLELVFEHRNYLPDVGLALALVMLPWQRWLRNELALPLVRLGMCVLVLATLGTLTVQRAQAWSSSEVLFPSLFELNPDSPRLVATFADSYARAGDLDAAFKLLASQRTVGAALQGLDLECVAGHRFEPARLQAVVRVLSGVMTPYEVQRLVFLANDVLEQKCGLPLDWGLDMLDRALSLPITQASSRQLLWLYHAHLNHAMDRLAEAQRDLDASAQSDASNPLPLLLATEWALQAHAPGQARASFARAERVTGRHRAEYDALYHELSGRLQAEAR